MAQIATLEIAVTIMVDVVIAAAADEGKAWVDVDLDEHYDGSSESDSVIVPWGLQISMYEKRRERDDLNRINL